MNIKRPVLIYMTILGLMACKEKVQSQSQFERAMKNFSTSPSVVKIELIDPGTGASKPQCVIGRDLLEAVIIEQGLSHTAPDMRKAWCSSVRAPSHRFVFHKKTAFARLYIQYDRGNMRKACKIIDRGAPAIQDDLSGKIVEGESSPRFNFDLNC